MRILMVGCGDLGSRIARGLLEAGAEIYTLTRRDPRLAGTRCLLGDVTEDSALPGLPDAFDAVVYCLTPGSRDELSYRRVYVDGLAHVLARLPVNTPPRICFISSTAVYGASQGAWVDELTACDPDAFNGRVLLEAESIALSMPRALVLRLGGIYGPGRESLLRAVIAQGPLPRSAVDWGNRVHVLDAAEAACHLILAGLAGVYNIVDDTPAPPADVMAHLARRLQLPELAISQDIAETGGRRVRNAKLRATGYKFRYPDFRAGYDQLLADRAAFPADS